VRLKDISNKALKRVGTQLKHLHDFYMYMVDEKGITDSPLNNGIRAMLKGCIKLEKLGLNLGEGGLTDVGLGYIGKYGYNLRCLFLSGCTGESDAGLLELSKGCPKLRKLNLEDCPFSKQAVATFVFNIQSLRYIWSEKGYDTTLTRPLTRPTFTAEVILLEA
ncbi:nucleosome assembly protein 1,4, partial [Tanacetum coccineum]